MRALRVRYGLAHHRLRVNLLPVGEQVRELERAVDATGVEADRVRAGGDGDEAACAGADEAASFGHAEEICVGEEVVTVAAEPAVFQGGE